MAESFKRCPICAGQNHQDARVCATCGTTIADVEAQSRSDATRPIWRNYDFRHGETDLYEGSVHGIGRALSALLAIVVIILTIVVIAIVLSSQLNNVTNAAIERSPTARPTRPLRPSVTLGIPTATYTASPNPTQVPTDTPTPSPCIHQVAAGDSLIAIVSRCGHRTLEILPTVMAINGIVDETRIQIGQRIIVPLPSPTIDPRATAQPTADSSSQSEVNAAADGFALLSFDPSAPTLTPTLLPGLMWHRVAAGENMIVIARRYDSNAKQLSDLNPEIPFSLCEFGLQFGGPECIVELTEGQNVRVPAPTPTITPIPTESGTRTATPPATATYNAPHALSPGDREFFGANEQITLRWVSTGVLGPEEVYQVAVSEVNTGELLTAETRDLFMILPPQWQADDDQRHSYVWQISVVSKETGRPSFATDVRSFVWEGAGERDS